jgi:hypothetical protein
VGCKKINAIPVIIGAVGTISTFRKYLRGIEGKNEIRNYRIRPC